MGGPSVASGVVDEKLTDVEAWEPDGPTFRGFTEKVWTVSNSPMCFTEIVVGVLHRPHGGEGETAAWRCSSRRNTLPNHI